MAVQHGTPEDVLLSALGVSIGFQNEGETVEVTHGVSFDVRRGETLAIVGESGSGKTVTAMAVLDLLPKNARREGQLLFRDEDLITVSRERMRAIRGNDIAMVFQEPMTAFNPVYTIGRQISDAIRTHEGISRQAALKRTVELLELVGIPEPRRRLNSFPHQLSGGQRQRAMIAMAISGNPSLLIADEPTTALDVTVQAEVLRLLRTLQTELGMAIVLITHDMGVVAEMADRVVVMRNGEVVEHADVFELFAAPNHDYTRKLLDAVPRASVGEPQAVVEERPAALDAAAVTASDKPAEQPALLVQNLKVRYRGGFRRPGFLAVDGVSFSIPQGEVMGLVGESGSGKSTIGKSIVGLAPIESGDVRIAGLAVSGSQRSLRAIRKEYGMVFQDPASSLNPRVSIGESVAEPLTVHRPDLSAAQRKQRVTELLEQVELPAAWSSRYPHELSGGQRQRIGIARALALDPKLLIADEPTSALDVSVQAAVLEIFRDLQQKLGFSCLFISHDLAVVDILSDQVAVLQGGKLVESGRTEDVLRSPKEEYTQRLVNAAPVPDPKLQRERAAAR